MESYSLGGSETKQDWYPKEKINYVKRKLKGDNPAYITRLVPTSLNGCSLSFESLLIYEPRCEKTDFLHMRKQRRRSAAQ